MIVADAIAVVEVVLQTNLGKLARIISQVGRDAITGGAVQVSGVKNNFILGLLSRGDIIAAQTSDPAFAKPVEELGINAVVG